MSAPRHVSFREALGTWVRVGLLSFGGPAGQIAVMHRIVVEEKGWVDEKRFLGGLNFCMLLPGPEAMQLATWCGWRLHRTLGGVLAGTLFVLPGFLSILVLSILYASLGETLAVQALFYGIKPAVLAVVVHALARLGGKALRAAPLRAIAVASFVAIFCFRAPFPAIVLCAALAGVAGARWRPALFAAGALEEGGPVLQEAPRRSAAAAAAAAARTAGLWGAVWLLPLAGLWLLRGGDDVLVAQGAFFSKVAVVILGGAYAVLAYVAQTAVETHGWLLPGEMLDGLGMAETTPGPLIQVLQFVAFMGAWRQEGTMDPMVAGVAASVAATWFVFVPSFLFVFTAAPLMERLRGSRAVEGALTGITAAVVGVIANLALWFGLHTVFARVEEFRGAGLRIHLPQLSSLDPLALVLAAAAVFALFVLRAGLLVTLGGCAAAGFLLRMAAGA